MKKGLISGLVLLVIGLVCGAVLAGVNAFTRPVILENELRAKLAILSEFYNVNDYEVELIEIQGPIDTVFLLRNKTNNTVIEKAVYSVRARGYQSDIVMLIAVNSNLTIDQYKVVSQAETTGIGDVIVGFDFGMTGQNVQNLDAFSGPTARVSSDAVYQCFEFVRDRVAIDFAGSVPTLDYTFDGIVYNLDEATLLTKPFIATITVGENAPIELYLALDFSFVELVNGTDPVPSNEILADVKLQASQATNVSRRTYISAFDAVSKSLVVKTMGYNFDAAITISITLSDNLDEIVSFTITSAESYADGGYDTHGNAPGLENFMMNRYLSEQSVDSVAGATFSANAMIRATQLIELFLNRENGGA